MAYREGHRHTAFGMVTEALRLTWSLRVPYVILTVLFSIPVIAATALGLSEPMNEFTRQAQNAGDVKILAQFPLGSFLLSLAIAFAMLSLYAIFWYRYLLVGPAGALKLGFGQFLSMFGRFTGYSVLVMTIGVAALTFVALAVCGVVYSIGALIGASGTRTVNIIAGGFVGMAYMWTLSVAVRIAFVFPAIALGWSGTLRKAWAASKEFEGSLLWAIIFATVPILLFVHGVHAGITTVVGIDFSTAATVSRAAYWWVDVLLAPLNNLHLAVMLGIVSVAYRDLTTPRRAPVISGSSGPVTSITA